VAGERTGPRAVGAGFTVGDLVRSGRIVDFIVAFVVIEALLLWTLRGRLPGRLRGADLFGLLAPGVCLLLALRGALHAADWTVVAGWLTAALVTHLYDLTRRFGR
jgi:hypothetical protein